MAFRLKLPQPWESQGWKVKVRDRERVEPPHITIIFRRRAWRLGLRDGEFLDEEPDPSDVPTELVSWVREQHSELVRQWDRMYPENPVQSACTPAANEGDDR